MSTWWGRKQDSWLLMANQFSLNFPASFLSEQHTGEWEMKRKTFPISENERDTQEWVEWVEGKNWLFKFFLISSCCEWVEGRGKENSFAFCSVDDEENDTKQCIILKLILNSCNFFVCDSTPFTFLKNWKKNSYWIEEMCPFHVYEINVDVERCVFKKIEEEEENKFS